MRNRIIISSIHYKQLDGIRYFEVPIDKEGFKNSILSIAALEDEQLINYANQDDDVKSRFSAEAWERNINALEKK